MQQASLKKTASIISWILIAQVSLLVVIFWDISGDVPRYLGFISGGQGNLWAWLLAAVTVIIYVGDASRMQPVREYMFKFDTLKIVAVMGAIAAGILEEVIFRKLVMDFLHARDYGYLLQVVVSAISFGIAHVVWGARNWSAGVNAVISTSLLGAALAVVYIVGGRSLAPCVVAHILVSALIEPGMIHAAVQDRIGTWKEKPAEH